MRPSCVPVARCFTLVVGSCTPVVGSYASAVSRALGDLRSTSSAGVSQLAVCYLMGKSVLAEPKVRLLKRRTHEQNRATALFLLGIRRRAAADLIEQLLSRRIE